MVQTITNYASYDLAYYYADLARLPRFSQEERQHLTDSLAQTTRLDRQARNQLIEGHLPLATSIAIDRCPPPYYRSLPDILGEVALTLVTITDRYDFQAGKDFPSYVVACTEGVVKRTLAYDRLIKVPSSTLSDAKQKGTEQRLYDLQPSSLDEAMKWFTTDEVEEPPTSPLLPTHAAPPRAPELQAQVQAWLSYLPPRAQRILTLRYGLSDEDERCLPPAEIARELGLTPQVVHQSLRNAKESIRALAEGTATIVEKNGKRQVRGTRRFKPPTLTPEHEMLFTQAASRLCEQDSKVSGNTLAKETGKSIHLARAFLRQHRDELSPSARVATHQERLAHVAQIAAELEAQGEHLTAKRLAHVAHVRHETALEFMRTRRKGEGDAATAQAR